MTVVTALRTDGSHPILVTGGAGFIGANFVLDWRASEDAPIVTLDKLTYAENLHNLADLQGDERHSFVQGDIGDVDFVRSLLSRVRPRAIVNFAAESHVDRSILGPEDFITTNIVGTFRLLETAREYWTGLPPREKEAFRFLHVSTDEVYGSLTPEADPFHEASPYSPNSPYSASKAASDHLVRAWHHTYGLPVIITNCSNNYGPYQFPEKLIPLMIHHALAEKPLPVYGDGQQIRDWLYVSDHCSAIRTVLRNGQPGHTYAIGGNSEKSNLDVVQAICDALDEERPSRNGSYRRHVTFVPDRPGHDRRYAINAEKIRQTLGWNPRETFESGLRKTVRWYLDNTAWTDNVVAGSYRDWLGRNYSSR
ncbi:MAG: dTDP-glucose 4,6-dehydratase [Pseudomonadota bacterium]